MRQDTLILSTFALCTILASSLACVLPPPDKEKVDLGYKESKFKRPSPSDDMGSYNDEDMASKPDQSAPSRDLGAPPRDQGMTPRDMAAEPDQGEDMSTPAPQDMCEDGPLSAPIPNCRPAPLPSTGDNKEDCVQRINQLRWECQCLPPLQRWTDGEQCADQHAAHDAERNAPHDAFNKRICSPGGFGQNECPRYGTWDAVIGTCLQQMWDEGPGEPFSEHGHYLNMTNERFSMVACGEGGGWFLMNFQ